LRIVFGAGNKNLYAWIQYLSRPDQGVAGRLVPLATRIGAATAVIRRMQVRSPPKKGLDSLQLDGEK
jgi:hypothetical protein